MKILLVYLLAQIKILAFPSLRTGCHLAHNFDVDIMAI